MRSIFALDALALRAARDLSARAPRADYTIVQLPVLAAPLPTDLIPIYHNGQTYQIPFGVISSSGLPSTQTGSVTTPADGTNTSGPTGIVFVNPFPNNLLGVQLTVNAGAVSTYALNANSLLWTRFGFSIVAFGNPNASSTCIVSWLAWGN